MDIIEDVLGINNNNRSYTNNVSKEDWKDKQKQDRSEIYNTIEKMTTEIVTDSNKFKRYLEMQSKFSKYSVGNCLVLLDKAPDSTHLKDKKSWEEKGVELKENAKGIQILEPKVINDKIYYNPKVVYDISQTNSQEENKQIKYDDRTILEALLYNIDANQQAVDELENGTIGAEYDKENNILYVCRGMDRDLLFKSIVQEIANYELRNTPDSELKDFNSYCISYMMCQRFGIDVSSFDFRNLPPEISKKVENKEIRRKLESIKVNYEKINSRISQYFQDVSKEKNKNKNELGR